MIHKQKTVRFKSVILDVSEDVWDAASYQSVEAVVIQQSYLYDQMGTEKLKRRMKKDDIYLH